MYTSGNTCFHDVYFLFSDFLDTFSQLSLLLPIIHIPSTLHQHLYEVVTSEQSYLQSLTVAVEHFQESSVLKNALAPRDRKSLFSSIAKIKEFSQR